MSVTIREKDSGTALAEAELGEDAIPYEGNLYFAASTVNQAVLKTTERTYTCPMKGVCHWVDFVGPDGRAVPDVAWIYATPKSGHERIKDRYGFYASSRGPTRREG